MGSYVPPTSLLSSIFLPNPLKDIKKEVYGNADSNSRSLQASTMIDKWKKLQTRMHSFPFLLPPCLSPLHLEPPRVGEKEGDDQPKNRSSNSQILGQMSSVDPLAKTDDQDTSAKWECRQSPILMPPRVAKILNQENHVSTTQWLPEDVWKDLNFMVGLSSKVMRCVCGLEKWYHILKPEEATKLYSNHFIKVRRMFFERCVNKAVERMEDKGGIRLSIREVFCVSYQELRRMHCKKE